MAVAPASTMGHRPASVELHVFLPAADGGTRSVLYEDDGETFAFRDDGFYRTEFTLEIRGDTIALTAVVTGNGYPEFVRKEFVLVFHGFISPAVVLNGQEISLRDNRLVFDNEGKDFSLHARKISTSPAL